MIKTLYKKYHQTWNDFTFNRAKKGKLGELTAHNLYILPTSFGVIYAIVVCTLFLCAINYQISLIFFMTFFMVIAAMVSAYKAQDNLKGLQIHCLNVSDAIAGKAIQIQLILVSEQETRYDVICQFYNQNTRTNNQIPSGKTYMTLSLSTDKRGVFLLPKLKIASYYPFGLFYAWGYIYFASSYYVYPKPVSPGFWPRFESKQSHANLFLTGDDELYELKKTTEPWRQANQVAWKITARGQGWYVKTLNTPEGLFVHLNINDLPKVDIEHSLENLSFWLHQAEENGYFYSLQLNEIKTPTSKGSAHLTQCLRQLASYS